MSLDHTSSVVKPQTVTRDAFLDGRLQVLQPRNGFRAGLDSVLLGASVSRATGALLDLGAGVGTATLVALAGRSELSATLVESDPLMLPLCADNLAANGVAGRTSIVELDVTASGRQRAAAGLVPDHFAVVIANPPYFDSARGTSAATARMPARQMEAEALDRWVRTAASHAAPGGEVIFIYPAAGLPGLLSSFTERFGSVTVLPFAPRPDTEPTRVLLRGIKGSRAPFHLLAMRTLHLGEAHEFAPEIAAILKGNAQLHW